MMTALGRLITVGAMAALFLGADAIKTRRFRVEFVQDGAVVPVEGEVVRLNKAPFAVRVTLLKGQDGVVVSSSFRRRYWDLGNKGSMDDVAPLPSETMAEEKFNTDRTLLVHEEYVSYWFHDPGQYDWHRFDPGVEVSDKAVIGTHSVDTLFLVEQRTAMPVSRAAEPLYFMFLARTPFVAGGTQKELSRARVRVDWK